MHSGSELGFAYEHALAGNDEVFFSAHVAGGAITVDGLQLSSGAVNLIGVAAAAANDNYLVVWEDNLHIRYSYLVGGTEQSSGQVDTVSPEAKSPDVVWTGSQFVVIWEDYRNLADDVLFMRALAL